MTGEYIDRLEKTRAACRFEKISSVPSMSSTTGWAQFGNASLIPENYSDIGRLKETLYEYSQRYDFDCYLANETPLGDPVMDILGYGQKAVDKDGEGDDGGLFKKNSDFDRYIEDYQKFINDAFALKYPHLETAGFAKAILAFWEMGRLSGEINSQVFEGTINRPLMCNKDSFAQMPFESFLAVRGTADIVADLRRDLEKTRFALSARWQQIMLSLAAATQSMDKSHGYVCDINTTMKSHNFLSEKQFSRVYWPYLSQTVDLAYGNGMLLFIFCCEEMLRFRDFFQDMPKGAVVLHPQADRILEVRNLIPRISLSGGFPRWALSECPARDCRDAAQMLVDEMREGYIFGIDDIHGDSDSIKRENLEAVASFIDGYKII
ncbi:MAG: hypothetical protein FWG10_13245 [Eubacteriaceae bacterium]|nr:hypothetical protein [Eubacteriaceae bacterium]